MQNGPPLSPGFSSPPVKKLRAGGSPQERRRAELQRLARSPNSQVPSPGSLMNRARSSLKGPPVMASGSLRKSAIPSRNGSNAPIAPSSAPPINSTFFPPGQKPKPKESPAPSLRPPDLKENNHHQGGGGALVPPIPPAAGMAAQPRKSDIFPGVQKVSFEPPQPSPKTPQPVTTPQVTAAALKSDATPSDADARIARRLDMQFTPGDKRNARSKSAPPARPPPPPRPPQPESAGESQPKSSKTVSFSSPVEETAAATVERPPEETPAPLNGTPFPNKAVRDAGHTPYRPVTEKSPEVDRRDIFLQMRSAAHTPADLKTSPEIRLQKELSSAHKEKAQALRQVTELEGELQNLKEQQQHNPASSVGFLSPILGKKSSRILRKTPRPKRRVQNGGVSSEREEECLTDATRTVSYEYVADEGNQGITAKIRRPFGLDTADERDVWFRYGFLNAKLYRKSATIEYPSTLEIATSTLPDGSVLSMHGEADHVHHFKDGTYQADSPLGTIEYIDDDGNDREFDLDIVFENLVMAREAYCTAVRSAADALMLQPPAAAAPPTSQPMQQPEQKDTVDKGIETDPVEESSPQPAFDHEEEMPMDVLGNAIYWCASLIVSVLVWIVKAPFRILGAVLFYSAVVALMAILWVQLKHALGGDEGNAMVFMHANAGGIM